MELLLLGVAIIVVCYICIGVAKLATYVGIGMKHMVISVGVTVNFLFLCLRRVMENDVSWSPKWLCISLGVIGTGLMAVWWIWSRVCVL